jgi:hypothetical protein
MHKVYNKFNSLLLDMYTEDELESTILNYQNKLNDSHLLNLVNYDIDYLSKLDYVDLQSVCKINKQLNNICSNDMILRNILFKTYDEALLNSYYVKSYKKQNIKLPLLFLPSNFPIAMALQSLYDNIVKLVYINYPKNMKWPRWINKEKFIEDMIRNIYWDLYYKITGYIYKKRDVISIVDLTKVEINKVLITFPFVSYNDEDILFEMDEADNKFSQYAFNELVIPDLFTNYLYDIFNHWSSPFDQYSGILEEVLWILLFFRSYSRDAVNIV